MRELHHRLIRIGLDALADDYGYALAGGYAVQAHHLVHRMSEDVDLFTPANRTAEMPQAVERLIAAYGSAGCTVELMHQADGYTRLNVTDPDTGATTKVELVAEFLHHPPVPSELGPVLHRDDLAAAKTSALFGRAEARDAIDILGLLRAGYTRARLIELVSQLDGGFDLRMFADSLTRVQRYSDKQFAAYDLTTEDAAALRRYYADWQQEIGEQLRPDAARAPSATSDPTSAPSPAAPPPSSRPPGADGGRAR
ncbi:nucleotidyl transferase AbiEii/AbiGii toxin family protein [Streptomyces sp. NPDC086554]|uniref:nucleotidyl transferase AbiEii/AbiGii toxin family protein n=1 Tax=Streptomyces sp. NPDC086554 TaxID=3154864 RepID=UPI003426B21D